MDIYEPLPKKVAERKVQFYVYKGRVRWWNGYTLCCEHKKRYCHTCTPEAAQKHADTNKNWRAENPEKSKERSRIASKKWRVENPEKSREEQRKWRAENHEKSRENSRKWRAENHEKSRENSRKSMRKWRAENLEKSRENSRKAMKKWRAENPEKYKERTRISCKKWRAENHEKSKEMQRAQYYKRRGYKQGDIQIKVWEEAMIQYLSNIYPSCEMILGKSIGSECTPKNTHLYPDVQLWMGSFLIVFECDENAHRDKSYDCDYARMNNIAISVGCPVWFIRWNPHGNENIEQIEKTVFSIMNMDDIVWTENRQFNVSYIGYSEKAHDRNEKRKYLAHHPEDTVLSIDVF